MAAGARGQDAATSPEVVMSSRGPPKGSIYQGQDGRCAGCAPGAVSRTQNGPRSLPLRWSDFREGEVAKTQPAAGIRAGHS